ncbi:hypothetical protein K474DRAFT_1665576 [Panus rudis PR-1116 ss-1]|nr:hypothetical protein K474DRAFT_1665576 [Panus rudis PR-1116 ss-1]
MEQLLRMTRGESRVGVHGQRWRANECTRHKQPARHIMINDGSDMDVIFGFVIIISHVGVYTRHFPIPFAFDVL